MTISITVIIVLFVMILMGLPVYISLGLSALIGIIAAEGIQGIITLPAVMYGQIDSYVLLAIPLYVLMGEVVALSVLASGIYDCLGKWLGKIPGGLSIATIFACCAFGAVSGSTVAGVAAFSPIAVPEMSKRGYDKYLAIGSITAAGSLAVLIPPSLAFIIYGSISLTPISKLFIAGIIPGIFLAIAMVIFVTGRAIVKKYKDNLHYQDEVTIGWKEKIKSIPPVIPAIVLAIFIFISLYYGICTPTELGALAAAGAVIFALVIDKNFGFKALYAAISGAARSTVTIGVIIASASCFGVFLNIMRVPEQFSMFCLSLPIPSIGVIFLFMMLLIILGCFMDCISLIVITTPILLPVVLAMGYDPIWYGVLLVVTYEISAITPPVGMNLYMMKSVIPELKIEDIALAAFPFVLVELICLVIFALYPVLSLWLPSRIG
ncbi:MAG: TRAP transporter large permease [Eubacteriales bacterium]